MVSVLKRLLGKALPYRRRVSYYESQTFMRHAVESVGFVDLIRFSDDELQQVIAANKNSRWVAAARREIATRRDTIGVTKLTEFGAGISAWVGLSVDSSNTGSVL